MSAAAARARAVRRATPDDVPGIVRLVNLAYRVEDFFVDGDRTHAAEVAAKMATPHGCFLALDDSDTAGLLAVVYTEIRGPRGYLGMLAVDPARQGQSVGRALVAAVEDHCRAAGCRFLDLDAVHLRGELLVIYRALGFAPFDTGPFPDRFKLRRPAHLVLMTKPLVPLAEPPPSVGSLDQ